MSTPKKRVGSGGTPGNRGNRTPKALPPDQKRVKVFGSVLPVDHARIVAARVGEEKMAVTVARLILAGLDRG
jgi:hypothetical protein